MSWSLEHPVPLIQPPDRGAANLSLLARNARPDDLDAIMEIEAAGHPTPWPRAIFEGEFDLAWSHIWVFEEQAAEAPTYIDNPGHAEKSSLLGEKTAENQQNLDNKREILAFLVFWVVHDEIHILNIVVAPTARRRGVASLIIDDLVERATNREISVISLEVRRHNMPAIRLYESHGFILIGERAGYYEDTGEDALILSRLVEEPG